MKTRISSIENSFEVSTETFFITIDYTDDIQKMIDDGKYDRTPLLLFSKKEDVKPKYEIGVRDYQMKILSINEYCTSKEIFKFIEKVSPSKTWKPARIEHLLALGKRMPQEQVKNPIIALATPITLCDGLNFPRLENHYDQRGISHFGLEEKGVCSPFNRFLIYRES